MADSPGELKPEATAETAEKTAKTVVGDGASDMEDEDGGEIFEESVPAAEKYTLCENFDKFITREMFHVKEFQEWIKDVLGTKYEYDGFDFSGIEQLTDQLFIALNIFKPDGELKSQGERIKFISLAGCIHVTDHGVKLILSTFKNLAELVLDGCVHLTESCLRDAPASLISVSLKGCNVAFLPSPFDTVGGGGDGERRAVDFSGCPLLPSKLADDTEQIPVTKLTVMVKDVCGLNVTKFLADAHHAVIDDAKNTMSVALATQVPGLNHALNIYECHCNTTTLSPLLTAGSMQILAVDIFKTENVYVFIATRVNNMLAASPGHPILVLCFHTGKDAEAKQLVSEMSTDILEAGGAYSQQRGALDTILESESFDNKTLEHDFTSQQRYARTHRVHQFSKPHQIFMYRVNSENSKVQQHWPPEGIGSTASEPKIGEGVYRKGIQAVEQEIEVAEHTFRVENDRLEDLTQQEMNAMAAINNPPQCILVLMESILHLFEENKFTWDKAKTFLKNPFSVKKLQNLPVWRISEKTLNMLYNRYLTDEHMQPNVAARVHPAAGKLCPWVHAVYNYGSTHHKAKTKMHELDKDRGLVSGVDQLSMRGYVEKEKELKREAISSLSYMEPGNKLVKDLSKGSIAEVRAMKSPPAAVLTTCQAVLALLGETDLSWNNVKDMLKKPDFVQRIEKLMDLDSIDTAAYEKLAAKYIPDEQLSIEANKRCSALSHALATFLHGLNASWPEYHQVSITLKQLETSKPEEIRAPAQVTEEEYEACIKELEADYNATLPVLEQAQGAISNLTKADLSMLLSFAKPPAATVKTAEAMCCIFELPERSWGSFKKFGKDISFMSKLVNYDKDNMPDKILKELDERLADEDLTPENLKKVSMAAYGFLAWLRGMQSYAHTVRAIAPKRTAAEKMKEELQKVKTSRQQTDESLRQEINAKTTEAHKDVETANKIIQSLRMSEVNEIKSMANPNATLLAVLEAVLTLFKKSSTSWTDIKKFLSNSAVLRDILYFEKDNVSSSVLKKAKAIVESPHFDEDKASKVSKFGGVMATWVVAILKYCDIKQDVEVLTRRREQMANSNTEITGSSSMIVRALSACVSKVNETRVDPPANLEIVVKARDVTASLVGEKVTDLAAVHQAMGENYSIHNVRRILTYLSEKGFILFFPTCRGEPVVTDPKWFVALLKQLENTREKLDLYNGSRKLCLPPNTPIFTKEQLEEEISHSQLQKDKNGLLLSVLLEGFGVVSIVPYRYPGEPSEPPYYWLPAHAPKKHFVRSTADEVKVTNQGYKSKHWPEITSPNFLNDSVLEYRFQLAWGVPGFLRPQLLYHCARMGPILQVWRWGVVIRSGGVDIKIQHNVHATLMCSSIDLEARANPLKPEQRNSQYMYEMLWGAASQYILLIEYLIERVPGLQSRPQIYCRGPCSTEGYRYPFNPLSFPRSLDADVQCKSCTNINQTLPKELIPFMSPAYRQHSLPFHDFSRAEDLDGNFNMMSPYAREAQAALDSGENIRYLCRHCGMTDHASRVLWEMESYVQPTLVRQCRFKKDSHIQMNGNIISGTGLIYCQERLFLTGLLEVNFTVLNPGNLVFLVGNGEYFDKFKSKDKTKKHMLADLEFDLRKGNVKFPDRFHKERIVKKEELFKIHKPADSCKCEAGDKVTVTLTKYLMLKIKHETRLFLTMELRKNGILIAEGIAEFRSFFGFVLRSSAATGHRTTPSVILSIPTYPAVKACHFPLGSSLLFKSQTFSQWNLGRVVSHQHGNIMVRGDSDEQMYSFHPYSEDIAPLNKYADGRNVVYPKVIEERNRRNGKRGNQEFDQIKKFLALNSSQPVGIGVFATPTNRDNNPTLHLRSHQPRYCIMNNHAPCVLEQGFIEHMSSEGKSLRTSNTYFHVIMPQHVDVETIYNPSRQVAQDWKKQFIHFLCKGSEWTVTGFPLFRDLHFMKLAPCDVTSEELQKLYPYMRCKYILQAYHHLENNLCLMPDYSIFPAVKTAGIPEEQLSRGLKEMFALYRATFLYLDDMIEEKKSREKIVNPAAAKERSEETVGRRLLLDKLPADETLAEDIDTSLVDGFTKSGFCAGHELTCKKGSTRTFGTRAAFADCGIYAQNISMLALAHVSLEKHSIKAIVSHFPNLVRVKFQGCGFTTLEGITKAPQLHSLNVSGNPFTAIPAELVRLKSTLQHLDVSNSEITELPEFVSQLVNLRTLIAYGTSVPKLPDDIGNLGELRVLNLNHTLVNKLPQSFRKLRNLMTLSMDGIPWTSESDLNTDDAAELTFEDFMDKVIRGSKKREKLISEEEARDIFDECDISKDGIISGEEEKKLLVKKMYERFPRFGENFKEGDTFGGMPPEIFSCMFIRNLSLKYQGIRFIPQEISILRKLTVLNLNSNPFLTSLHANLGKCNMLRVVTLIGCPNLRTPPPEILGQGMKTVIAYLKRLSMGSTACYRTKLMFVGLGGAGKTSMMRALRAKNSKAPNIEGEGITDGIDIDNWPMSDPKSKDSSTVTFSVWDFAGQTVYYNTHQFFLSSRAIYILVWNTRLGFEHSGLEFWLSSIACHCPTAPTFIVGTRADQITNPELPMQALLKRYKNITGFFTVSSLTGQGIAELKDTLYTTTMAQPYIGEMIPDAWLNLENAVVDKRRDTKLLKWDEFEKMAKNSGIYGVEIKQAATFLHEMGSLQHFDTNLLRDRVVISPQWIVDVMACVVSVQNKVIKDGRLRHQDIHTIWRKYPDELYPWMLRLTEVFDLTFPLNDRPENVIPCLLPQTEPDYDWPDVGEHEGFSESYILYNFDYLPAGLFNRCQVRLYEYSDSSAIWKTGSLLKKNGHHGLFSQINEKDIRVTVCGPRPDNILLMIHEVIEALIAEFFKGVKYEYKIPCADCVKMDTKEPTLFSSKVLRRAIELKALFLQCHTFFHTLSIKQLQDKMPPQSTSDYDLQLQNTVNDLESMEEDIGFDVFFLQCNKDIPADLDGDVINPRKIHDRLKTSGFDKMYYSEQLNKKKISDVAVAMQTSKMILVLISDDFCQDAECNKMFQFVKEGMKKDFVVLMVGSGREWMKSSIGLQIADKVFINFQRKHQFEDKFNDLRAKLEEKLGKKKVTENQLPDADVFISYAWVNSQIAVDQGHARPKDGALGFGDPRKIKTDLESQGLPCWLDIERTGRMGLFHDIADGIRKCKVVVACLSDEYAMSTNCQMEFRFAHVSMKKPIIVVAVGTGLRWQSTEIGMLSLEYPKVNLQASSPQSEMQLLTLVKEAVEAAGPEEVPRSITPAFSDSKERAFQELYEMAQRKFLRQIAMLVGNSEQFPRLFVADLNYDPNEAADTKSVSDADDVEIDLSAENKPTWVAKDLQAGMFCMKSLCEYEGGWHTVEVDSPITVELGGETLAQLWELTAPFMARILAILKHSPINLHIVRSAEGSKLMKLVEQTLSESKITLKQVYLALRDFMIKKDTTNATGNLKRCYLPSGKILWLCEEHQQMNRVTVLDEDEDAEGQGDAQTYPSGQLEEELLRQLNKHAEASVLMDKLEDMSDPSKIASSLRNRQQLRSKSRASSAGVKKQARQQQRPVTPEGDDILKQLQSTTSTESGPKPPQPTAGQSRQSAGTVDTKPGMKREGSRADSSATSRGSLTEAQKKSLAHRASAKQMTMNGEMPTSRACVIL